MTRCPLPSSQFHCSVLFEPVQRKRLVQAVIGERPRYPAGAATGQVTPRVVAGLIRRGGAAARATCCCDGGQLMG
jgi:hypothetical protein